MRKVFNLFYCAIIFAGLQSCRKDAEVKLPNVEPKLVISSFISPQDSLIQVAVSLSSPLYNNPEISNKYSPLLDATVTINIGTNSYNLTYNSILERYVIDSFQLKITAGLTYYLSVKAPDGKFADANTTIPLLNNTLTYTVSKKTASNNEYTLQGTWVDNDINNRNDYRFDVTYIDYIIYGGYIDTVGDFNDTIKYWPSNKVFTNDDEGSIFKKELQFNYRTNKNDTVFTRLTTISQEYVDYYEKIDKAIALGDQFSEPVQMYPNIKGGFGVFAGFNEYKLRVFP
jgi:hypothetical protein